MLDCKHASHLISQSMERRLSLGQRIGLRLHLMLCDACTQFARQMVLLRQAVSQLGSRIEGDERLKLSADARLRISAAMKSQAQTIVTARQNPDQNFTD